ncbi:MAG TPA: glycine cleavage T C-terminal barrel domain-containing protein [Myxococcota bacterium]|nr:glycine cleavage T C-terminal barrel domain-containing protein [Myxococcota bacterium]
MTNGTGDVGSGAGLFALGARGLVEVRGGDRVRWLNGMLTNDVAAAAARGTGAGCYALLLTREGRVVADLHVLVRDDSLWLETEAAAVETVIARLAKYVIADDVVLADRSSAFDRLAVEGPGADRVLAGLASEPPPADSCADLRIAGTPVVVAAFAFAGGPGFQLFVPAGRGQDVSAALLAVGAPHGLVASSEEVLERLRIEAGVPRLGRELDESVLPDEARLERAVSTTKGCYTGQEVVARMRSRGRVSHLLVGLHCVGGSLPAPRAPLEDLEGKRVGEVTSAVLSPRFGAIALAYVRRPWDAPGTRLRVGGGSVEVASLPFGLPREAR